MVHYVPYGTVRVSKRWAVVLRAADKARVRFHVNSGHRTMSEQWALYQQNMSGGHPKPGHPLTAFPTPNAPHIRVGRSAHALDVNTVDGGESRLQHWLERQGVHPTNPVRGEAWHLELSGSELKRLWKRFR